MGELGLDDLRALARSSPWRWRTLVLRVRFRTGRGPAGPARPPEDVSGTEVRAWVRRPHGLRVVTVGGGDVLTAAWHTSPWGFSSVSPAVAQGLAARGEEVVDLGVEGGRTVWGVPVGRWLPGAPGAPRPVLRAAGLVVRRPPETGDLRYDDPMWQTYRWVAMLDPVELADGSPPADEDGGRYPATAAHVPVRLAAGAGDPAGGVREVHHHGRRAWEAALVAAEAYAPRCECCPLLDGEVAHRGRLVGGGVTTGAAPPEGGWPAWHRVRLDHGTGVVVELETVGGHRDGEGWTAVVESVDTPLDRSLFVD